MDLEIERTVGKTEPPPGGSVAPSPSPATKGRGLRKWRRIHRESGKEQNSNFDNNKKRGIALPGGMKQSEGSSSSTNAMSNIIGNALDHINVYGDSSSKKGPDFGSRADSENSRSSTGASVPRGNQELFNMSLKNSDSFVQKSDQKEKDPNVKKKFRGLKLEKENSISSLESDSRSSNFVFLQGANSMNSNGRLNGRSGNYAEDDSDDARDGDSFSYPSHTKFSKNHAGDENASLEEDLAGENSWDVNKEKIDDRVGSGDCDPLVESIIPLHLAQEALEREVQKLRNVGKEDIVFTETNEVDLQNELEEAFNALEIKNTKISELESSLNSKKIQTEYEELMTQRLAAEVEYLVISKTIQNLKTGLIGQTNLAYQKNVSAITPAPEEEDAKKLKNRVWRYVYCLIIQSVLLLVVLYIIVLKFSSKTVEVIPT